MDTTTPTGPRPNPSQEQDPEAQQLRTIRLLSEAVRHAYQQGWTDALLGRRRRPARPTGPAGRTDHPGPPARTTGPGRRSTPPQQEDQGTRPSTVLDPADGTVLATLDPEGARVVPTEGVTVGPVADVNGITVQALSRQWGARPTTYYVIQAHTSTVPLTRGEVARLAQVLIDVVAREVAS
ncbi:hypothetical protein [Actinomyces wuliandei]|uniref:hypothetical protein n=1 Tax=Actinomyces wuliandei TaxID=2057743 RepID=UPI001119E9E6|nr:hypothetical protein [Actinomyces wuliandei]